MHTLLLSLIHIFELTRAVSESVGIPVIASGGAGELKHFYDAFTVGKADAVLDVYKRQHILLAPDQIRDEVVRISHLFAEVYYVKAVVFKQNLNNVFTYVVNIALEDVYKRQVFL